MFLPIIKETWKIESIYALNNSKLRDYVHRIYPMELEIKYTTDTARPA
jgi:hypothetical protein